MEKGKLTMKEVTVILTVQMTVSTILTEEQTAEFLKKHEECTKLFFEEMKEEYDLDDISVLDDKVSLRDVDEDFCPCD